MKNCFVDLGMSILPQIVFGKCIGEDRLAKVNKAILQKFKDLLNSNGFKDEVQLTFNFSKRKNLWNLFLERIVLGVYKISAWTNLLIYEVWVNLSVFKTESDIKSANLPVFGSTSSIGSTALQNRITFYIWDNDLKMHKNLSLFTIVWTQLF